MEDGVGGQRGLVTTMLALIFAARCDQVGLIMVTARAAKAIGPLAFDEISKAITLGAKPPSKLSGGHRCIHGSPPL